MQHIKLSIKIGFGFAALLLVVCALGAMAIINMDKVSTSAEEVSSEYVPQVTCINQIERHVLLLMYAMRGFSMAQDQSYRDKALTELSAVKENLRLADELAQKHPEHTDFQNNLLEMRKQLAEYENKATETETLVKQFQTLRDKMQHSANLFLTAASDYHDNQISTQEKEFTDKEPNFVLRQRAGKIKIIYVIVQEAQAIQKSNIEAQLANNPQQMEDASQNFFVVYSLINNIRKKTKQEQNLKSLDKITQLCKEYEAAMNSALETWKKLIVLDQEQNQLALAVLKDVENMAKAGIDSMRQITTQNVAQLHSANVLMEIGLGIALLIGVFLSIAITTGHHQTHFYHRPFRRTYRRRPP